MNRSVVIRHPSSSSPVVDVAVDVGMEDLHFHLVIGSEVIRRSISNCTLEIPMMLRWILAKARGLKPHELDWRRTRMNPGSPPRDDHKSFATGLPDDRLDRHRHSWRSFSTWPKKYDCPLLKDRIGNIASQDTRLDFNSYLSPNSRLSAH